MHKITKYRRAILFSGFCCLPFGNLFAGSDSQAQDLPVAISYETMTASERVEAGLVAAQRVSLKLSRASTAKW